MAVREVEASVGQRLLWLMDHYRRSRGELNEWLLRRLSGPLDRPALERAVADLTHRHEALRTTFATRGRRLVQVVHEPGTPRVGYEDLSGAADPEHTVRQELEAETASRIDVTRCPLRARLWRIGPDDHVFSLTMHHLVTDEWSTAVIARDLARLYEGAPLPDLGWQYGDWADWQRRFFADGGLSTMHAYWRNALDGVQIPELPGRPHATDMTPGGPRPAERVPLPTGVVDALGRLARAERTTLFVVLLAVFYSHLHATTGQHDLAVASLFANRARPEVRGTVGFFVNMVVLRARFAAGEPFDALVRTTRRTVMDALANQALPYQMLPPHAVRGGSAAGGVRADDTVFQLIEVPAHPTMRHLRVEPLAVLANRSRFALELAVVVDGDRCDALLFYDPARFDGGWARRFVAGYAEHAGTAAAQWRPAERSGRT